MFNNKNISLASRLPQHFLARTFNAQPPMPFSYTLGLTYRCNLRCKTCRVYEKAAMQELTLSEWILIFKSIKQSPYWVTYSGGEPFLFKDIVELHDNLCRICKPSIVNIPTNGSINCIDKIKTMCETHPEVKLVVNVSIDHYNPHSNDIIRGRKHAFYDAIATYGKLRRLKYDNLTVGIHTVISRFNVKEFKEICDYFLSLQPDQYITEIAEERFELGTVGLSITPDRYDYADAVEYLRNKICGGKWKGVPKITESFREKYYGSVVNWLDDKYKKRPCYAGRINVQIDPTGDIWPCCITAESMGNLRYSNYSFEKIWTSHKAKKIRRSIRKCSCPMANIYYSNSLLNPLTLLSVVSKW